MNGADLQAWHALLEALPHAAWVVALKDRRVVGANAAAGRLLGCSPQSLVGASVDTLAASPEDLFWWEAAAAGDTTPLHSDVPLATPDGRVLRVGRSIRCIDGDHALVVLCDLSAEERAESARENLLAELQATLEATADGILVTDQRGRITACNARLAEIWALPAELLESRDDIAIQAWMAQAVDDGPAYAQRLLALSAASSAPSSDRLHLRSGQVLERVTRPLLRNGHVQGRVWSFRDLTERIAAEERCEAMALQDPLTGLPNRRGLAAHVDAATASAREHGAGYALLLVDLDRFRQINDSLGHDVGDRVLQHVAQRMRSCLRQDDVLARLGSDQFAVLVQPADDAAAEAAARRVLGVVAAPTTLDGAIFTITCSIGVALAPSHGSHIDELARHAETAMRAVKTAGRAHFLVHQARAETDRRQDMQLDHAMRQALVSGRFRLHYQPQVALDTGRIVGAEALLRWRDPEMGEVSPGRFIPVAEDSGFIVPIGDWVLSQAVRQAALWHARGHDLPIAVNVSALQFKQPHFVDRVAAVLAVAGLPARLLELELTESILVRDADDALARLHALARLGVQMSIDDFGTGYSSLSYLKRFPIGKLKIDRSFVNGLPDDDSDAGIVRAILQMARALRMKVIAEGVENESQRQFLQDEGCDEFQGWLYAPALDARSFEQRVAPDAPAAPAALPAGARPYIRLVNGR